MINPDARILMVDTETTNDIDCPICYDVGYQIFDLHGNVYCERSFVNADVFLDKTMMSFAFFADKIPSYWEDIKSGVRELKTWFNIKKQLADDCARYNVSIACAHNAAFDNRALNTTQRYITTSKYRYFLPYGIEWWDTLKMARETLNDNDNYNRFCLENNYRTKNGKNRYTAEIIYRWLMDNNDFEESHTGLEDVKIEKEIFKFCLAENPEINGKLWKD